MLTALRLVAVLDDEVAAGWMPELGTARLDSELAITNTLSPTLGLIEEEPVGTRFQVEYAPRATWRYPNIRAVERPLVLHQLRLVYSPILLPHTTLSIDSTSSLGEVDAPSVDEVFGVEQVSAPDPFIQIFHTTLTPTLGHRVTRATTFGLSTPVMFHTTLSDDPNALGNTGDALTVAVMPTVTHLVDGRNTVGVTASVLWADFERREQLASQIAMTWARRVSPRAQLNLSLGVGRTDALREPPPEEETETIDASQPVFLVGGAELTRQRASGQESVALMFDARVDPVVQQVRPVAVLSVSSTENLTPSTRITGNLNVSSVATTDPVVSETGEIITESFAGGRVAFIWDIGSISLRTGIAASARGPHWNTQWEFHEKLATAFVGVRWDNSSSQE